MTVSLLAANVILAGTAVAQQSHEQHHPGAATLAQGTQMPMREGMPGMQGTPGAAMRPGQGMSPGMMMGSGGMGQGMMGPGGMGNMMQGDMMGRDCPMMGMMMGSGTGSPHADGRVAFLKAELKITEAQQTAFDAYAAALKKNLEGMQAMRASMMERMKATSPGERLDAHVTAMEARLSSLKAMKEPLAKLYAVFTDEQKKTADQILTGMGCMM
jgi:hypothetical protein